MKKMKFDTLIESILLKEGNKSNDEKFANISFDLEKLSDKISDLNSDDYKSQISPFIERWKEQGYLDNLTSDQIKIILDEIHTRIVELNKGTVKVHTITYEFLKKYILNSVMRKRFPATKLFTNKEELSVLGGRWRDKFAALFRNLKDTQVETERKEQDDEDMGSLEGMESSMNKPTSAAEGSLLEFIHGSDGVSREEAVDFLSRKSGMGREPEVANNIINSLISKKEIIETEDGNLKINTESGVVDSLASDSDYDADDEIETGIPFRGRGIEDEDEDVADTFRRTTEGDGDFQRSGW
jgi:hypothetical protein